MLASIRSEDHHLFRVYKAHVSEVRLVLLQVLNWGCPKAATQTFDQYLSASGVSQTFYRKNFDRQQREKISVNPKGDRFDISLLYKMIQVACHSLAPPGDAAWTTRDPARLEYLLTSLKNSRNDLAHNMPAITKEEMMQQIEALRELLGRVVRGSGTLYCVSAFSVEEVLRRVNYNLTNIRDQPFAPLDLADYRSHLLFDSLRATLRLDGAKELKQIYSSKTFLDPLSFLDKSECHLRVGSVFICLLIQDISSNTHRRSVQYQELLEYCDAVTTDSDTVNGEQAAEDEMQKSSMIVLEGQPGSGKTTLLRLYTSEWIAGGGEIKGLSDFNLVLHFECRDPSIDSLTQLLLSHMPQTTTKFRKSDLLQIFLSLKVMILVDGLDELNIVSLKVLKEILYLKNSCDLTLICTTRAEKIREVYKIASGKVKVVHMKIQGIPIEKREEFVRVYHCRLKQRGVPQEDLDYLLDYLRNVPSHLQDFFKFPLNLVLLTFLWNTAKARIRKITSMTALYLEIHKLLIEKLLERLMYHPSTEHLPLAKLTRRCDSFLSVMYEEALRALSAGAVYLDKAATKRLRENCVSLCLPIEEMFSAFLVSVSYDSVLAHSKKLRFPHKGIQDFYAARHVTLHVVKGPFLGLPRFLDELDDMLVKSSVPTFPRRHIVRYTRQLLDQPVTIRNVLLEFHQDQGQSSNLARYQNVICHLVNLLHVSDRDRLGDYAAEHYAPEIVSLLAEEKGMSFDHWVDMLKEAHYNPVLANEISKVLPKSCWTVKDEHVEATAAFLSHNNPGQLTIDIMGDPEHVPRLHDLLETAATSGCKIFLYLHHHWRYPEAGLSNSFLEKLVCAESSNTKTVPRPSTSSHEYMQDDDDDDDDDDIPLKRSYGDTSAPSEPKTCLVEMMGHFTGMVVLSLPATLKELRLSLADDHDALDWFSELPKLARTLPSLRCIWLHVAPKVSPDLLPNLPQLLYRPRLYLSSVGDDNISWASRVARALLSPGSKYASLALVESSLSSRGVSQLVARLHHLAVGVYSGRSGGLLVASSNLADADLSDVRRSVLRYLSCPFSRVDGEEIWFDESMYEQIYEYSAPLVSARCDSLSSEEIYVHFRSPDPIYSNIFEKIQNMRIQEESEREYINLEPAKEEQKDENLDEESIYSYLPCAIKGGCVGDRLKSASNESLNKTLPDDATKKNRRPCPPPLPVPPPLPPRNNTQPYPHESPASSSSNKHRPPRPPPLNPARKFTLASPSFPLQAPSPPQEYPTRPPPPPPVPSSPPKSFKTHISPRPPIAPPDRSNIPRPKSDPSTPVYSFPPSKEHTRKFSHFFPVFQHTQIAIRRPSKPAIPLPLSPRLPNHNMNQEKNFDVSSPDHASPSPPQSPLTSLFYPTQTLEEL